MRMQGSFLANGKSYQGDYEFTKGQALAMMTDFILTKDQKIAVNLILPRQGLICLTAKVVLIQKKEGRVYHGLEITNCDFATHRKIKKTILSMVDYFALAA